MTLSSQSAILQMVEDAEWLASFRRRLFDAGGPFEADPGRAGAAFMRMEQARRLAELLTRAPQIAGARDHVKRWIRKRIDRIESLDEEAQDLLFELEIAGRLAKWRSIRVQLAEPDILFELPNTPAQFALACKRPRTIKSSGRALEEAAQQIRKNRRPGIIVLGMEAIFHGSQLPKRPVVVYQAETPHDAKRHGSGIMDIVAEETSVHQQRAFQGEVDGALLCGILTYWCKRPSAYAYAWLRRPILNPRVPESESIVGGLDTLLFERTVD